LICPPNGSKRAEVGDFHRKLGWRFVDGRREHRWPSVWARAVVDAMERDMGTALATKTNLLLIRQDIDDKFTLLSRDIESLRSSNAKDLEEPCACP
jgi:hypothetical protein